MKLTTESLIGFGMGAFIIAFFLTLSPDQNLVVNGVGLIFTFIGFTCLFCVLKCPK